MGIFILQKQTLALRRVIFPVPHTENPRQHFSEHCRYPLDSLLRCKHLFIQFHQKRNILQAMVVATVYKGPSSPSITSVSTFNCSLLSANGSDLTFNGFTLNATLNATELTFNCSAPSTTATNSFTFKGPTFFHLLRSLNLPAYIGKLWNDWSKSIHNFREKAVLHSDIIRRRDSCHSDSLHCGIFRRHGPKNNWFQTFLNLASFIKDRKTANQGPSLLQVLVEKLPPTPAGEDPMALTTMQSTEEPLITTAPTTNDPKPYNFSAIASAFVTAVSLISYLASSFLV